MSERCDIAIVGFGAAGMAAGIFAGQKARETGGRARIVALDGAKSIGAKILVSGGGRCNVTHDHITPADYNGSKSIVRNVLAGFDEKATAMWFESLGAPLKPEEGGKMFPASDSARTVVQALVRRCAELDVRIRLGHRVEEITPPVHPAAEFVVRHRHGELLAARVIIATGGRALPGSGSDGSGYDLVRRLGHGVSETYPALVPLLLDPSFFHKDLSGQSVEVELTTLSDGKVIDRRTGSLLWTHFGISGPVVLDASRHWVISHATARTTQMRCSFLPGHAFESMESRLIALAASRPHQSIARALGEPLPERLARAIVRFVGIDPQTPLPHLSRQHRRQLVHALTAMTLPVVGDRGWNHAEVTAGGVPLAEIDYRTMESRKTPGLYLVGEILDCDGRIGGFNLQWAWATGYSAGRSSGNA